MRGGRRRPCLLPWRDARRLSEDIARPTLNQPNQTRLKPNTNRETPPPPPTSLADATLRKHTPTSLADAMTHQPLFPTLRHTSLARRRHYVNDTPTPLADATTHQPRSPTPLLRGHTDLVARRRAAHELVLARARRAQLVVERERGAQLRGGGRVLPALGADLER